MTQSEKLSAMRKEARENGMTFKAINCTFDGKQGYSLFNRESGEQLTKGATVNYWFDRFLIGDFVEFAQ